MSVRDQKEGGPVSISSSTAEVKGESPRWQTKVLGCSNVLPYECDLHKRNRMPLDMIMIFLIPQVKRVSFPVAATSYLNL